MSTKSGEDQPGYELVVQNDLEGTNPSADTLVNLLEAHGPALIILDELVRLAQNVYKVEPSPAAGSFEAILAFMQSLTEAVKRSSDSLLLVSIPASERKKVDEESPDTFRYWSR